MKTLIITIVVLLLSINILFANNTDKQREDWFKIETYQDYLNYRYAYKPAKLYKADTDSDIMGIDYIDVKRRNNKKQTIQQKIKKTKNINTQTIETKYLNYIILQEENIL
jgi:hypothetical protein